MKKNRWLKNILIFGNILILPIIGISVSCSVESDKPDPIVVKQLDGSDWQGVDPSSEKLQLNEDFEIDPEKEEVEYTDCTKLISRNHLVIPNYVSVNDKPYKVKLGSNCFYQSSNIRGAVELNDFTTIIPSQCFYECFGLQTLVMHESPIEIQGSAFDGCSALNYIYIKYGDTYDKNWATKLKKIGNRAFYDAKLGSATEKNKIVFGPELESLGTNCFYQCQDIYYLDFSLCNKLTEIPDQCFYNCKFLSKVWFPSSIKKIGESAFASCTELTEIDLPNDQMAFNLSEASFSNCGKFKKFSKVCKLSPIKDSAIPAQAFENCKNLIIQPWTSQYGVNKLGSKAFYGTNFNQINLENNLKDVGDAAFGDMENLQVIDFHTWRYDLPPSWTCENLFPGKPESGIIKLPGNQGMYDKSWFDFLLQIGFKEEELTESLWQIQVVS